MDDDENRPGPSTQGTGRHHLRRNLTPRVDASDYATLADLVEEGLDDSDSLMDFDGSEFGDPNYEPSLFDLDEIGNTSDLLHNDLSQDIDENNDIGGGGDCLPPAQPMACLPDVNDACLWNQIGSYSSCSSFEDYGQDSTINIQLDTIDPISTYCHFITEDMWEYMVQETNRFAAQYKLSTEEKPNARSLDWIETDVAEMKRFVGILIVMGLIPLPSIDKYWSNDDMYGVTIIKDSMPRDRFLLLKKFWHFHDSEADLNNTDRLKKIRYFVNSMNKRYTDTVTPERNLVIDESMIPWRGRLLFRQYLPNKSHKYGVKVYKICTTEGYTLRVIIYTGKSDTISPKGHTYNVVMELLDGTTNDQSTCCRSFGDEGRHIYADNFYTSIQLAETLLARKTRLCGTIRGNRKGMPTEVNSDMRKGEAKGIECQHGTKIVTWKDKRVVRIITTLQERDATLVDTGKTNRKNEPLLKPQCVLDYNAAKKGVDLSDQMASYYCCLRKTLKWYTKVMLELITGTTMVNAWIVFETLNQTRMPYIKFKESVARCLLKKVHILESPANRKRAHTLKKTDGPARKTRRRCTLCYKNSRNNLSVKDAAKNTKQVTTYCENCPNKPFMCLDCFNTMHK